WVIPRTGSARTVIYTHIYLSLIQITIFTQLNYLLWFSSIRGISDVSFFRFAYASHSAKLTLKGFDCLGNRGSFYKYFLTNILSSSFCSFIHTFSTILSALFVSHPQKFLASD